MENIITITVEEYKSLLEAKILMQNLERKIGREKSHYMNKTEIMDIIGMEYTEEEAN